MSIGENLPTLHYDDLGRSVSFAPYALNTSKDALNTSKDLLNTSKDNTTDNELE